MGYKSAIKIGATLVGLGLLLYTIYKVPYLTLAAVGGGLGIDFLCSDMNPSKMYTFKYLNWVFKD